MIQNILIAGFGGFIGTIFRYLLNNSIYNLLNYPNFPYGTLVINIVGCFFIGLFAAIAETRTILTPEIRTFIQIGVLGGFTTFSTFGFETFSLMRDGQFIFATANVLIQVLIGLIAVWLGYNLGAYS